MTARLNAAVAQLQALEVGASLSLEYLSRDVARTELQAVRQRIALLTCEASLGFAPEPWTPQVELTAIRQYLREMFQDFQSRFQDSKLDPKEAVVLARDKTQEIERNLYVLNIRYRYQYADLASAVLSMHSRAPLSQPGTDFSTHIQNMRDWVQSGMNLAAIDRHFILQVLPLS